MLFSEAQSVTKDAQSCPSCGTPALPGRSECPKCGAGLSGGGPAGLILTGDRPRPVPPDQSGRAPVPVEYERAERPGEKRLLEPGDEIKVDRADMLENETYMCLICGSSVPALADRCPICGTIFVSEAEASTFAGIPVARLSRRGELEAAQAQALEAPPAEEKVNFELPLPRPLSAHALKEADVLPVHEPVGQKKAVVKKKVVKKPVEKTAGPGDG